MNKQFKYAVSQHDLCCDLLGVESRHDRSGKTLVETVCAMRKALERLVPQHSLACVGRLAEWSFEVDDAGRLLITPESCKCSDETKAIRELLPPGHPKGFSKTKQ